MANQRAALAEERLSELKAMLADMQRDRDAWREQAQRLALPAPKRGRATGDDGVATLPALAAGDWVRRRP
jgi:hypothetical protein